MKEKLAIIVSGGGLKAAFNTGALLALVKEYNIKEPFILIATSGGSGSASYYLAQQYDEMVDILLNYISKRSFINKWRFWKMINLHYLVDTVFKKSVPLKEEMIYSTQTHYLIPAFNKQTGEIDYFYNHDGMDVFESMRATKSISIAAGLNPGVKINNFFYSDSYASSRAKTHIKKAVEMSANKILLINNEPDNDTSLNARFFYLWLWFHKSKKRYYEMVKELTDYNPPDNVKILSIFAKDKIKVTLLNNDRNLLHEAFKQGYQEVVKNKKLRDFLD